MKLADLHQAFIKGIYQDRAASPEQFIHVRENMSAEDCLAIYRGSVFGNLSSALKDIYPALHQCLGDKFFSAMALKYIERYPSRSASLDNYGAEMASFVADFAPLRDLVYCADLARLEWAWHCAFHAKDEQVLALEALASLDEADYEHVSFILMASITLLESPYPIKSIWQTCIDERDGLGAQSEAPVSLDAGEQKLMIWRASDYEMRVDELSDLEYQLLLGFGKQKSLGTILTELQSKHPLASINQALANAVQLGWFVAYKLDR